MVGRLVFAFAVGTATHDVVAAVTALVVLRGDLLQHWLRHLHLPVRLACFRVTQEFLRGAEHLDCFLPVYCLVFLACRAGAVAAGGLDAVPVVHPEAEAAIPLEADKPRRGRPSLFEDARGGRVAVESASRLLRSDVAPLAVLPS